MRGIAFETKPTEFIPRIGGFSLSASCIDPIYTDGDMEISQIFCMTISIGVDEKRHRLEWALEILQSVYTRNLCRSAMQACEYCADFCSVQRINTPSIFWRGERGIYICR